MLRSGVPGVRLLCDKIYAPRALDLSGRFASNTLTRICAAFTPSLAVYQSSPNERLSEVSKSAPAQFLLAVCSPYMTKRGSRIGSSSLQLHASPTKIDTSTDRSCFLNAQMGIVWHRIWSRHTICSIQIKRKPEVHSTLILLNRLQETLRALVLPPTTDFNGKVVLQPDGQHDSCTLAGKSDIITGKYRV